jgi:hypothetical protein
MGTMLLLRHPETCGVRPLSGARHRTVGCEGACSCAGWGGMVRRILFRTLHPSAAGATRPWPQSCELRIMQPARSLPEQSRKGTSASDDSKFTDVGSVRAHVKEVQHVGLSREACCGIFKCTPKLLRCAGLQRAPSWPTGAYSLYSFAVTTHAARWLRLDVRTYCNGRGAVKTPSKVTDEGNARSERPARAHVQ